MESFSVKRSSSFILAVVLAALLLASTVRSDPDLLNSFSDQLQEQDLCPPSDPDICPINCFRPDPVCGSDGVTYWCGCLDAHCGGARVVKIGACDAVGNGGPGSGPAGQALLLVHIVWLILLGVLVLFGLF